MTKRNNPDAPAAQSGPAMVSPCAAYLRLKAVIAVYGFSRSAVYRALAEGKLTAVKAGRTVLIDGESVRAYLASLPRAVFRAPRQ